MSNTKTLLLPIQKQQRSAYQLNQSLTVEFQGRQLYNSPQKKWNPVIFSSDNKVFIFLHFKICYTCTYLWAILLNPFSLARLTMRVRDFNCYCLDRWKCYRRVVLEKYVLHNCKGSPSILMMKLLCILGSKVQYLNLNSRKFLCLWNKENAEKL